MANRDMDYDDLIDAIVVKDLKSYNDSEYKATSLNLQEQIDILCFFASEGNAKAIKVLAAIQALLEI